MTTPPKHIIDHAVIEGRASPCAKSKRGAVIYDPREVFDENTHNLIAMGHNRLPGDLSCDGSAACKASCAKACLHAEAQAIMRLPTRFARAKSVREVRELVGRGGSQLDLVHVKVVSGELVAGGKPSCWQCSRLVYEYGIAVWLYELPDGDLTGHDLRVVEGTWQRYSPRDFHERTSITCGVYGTLASIQ